MKQKPTSENAKNFSKEVIPAKSETESTNHYIQENYQNFNYKRAYSEDDEFAPKKKTIITYGTTITKHRRY
jgi:hypothetical protein